MASWLVKKFMKIYGIIVYRQFDYKRGSLPGLKLGGKARQTNFLTAAAKAAA
jgi:hypothetical protein